MNETQFPSWRYHRTEPARIVHNADELAELGEGWADTPAAFDETDTPEAFEAPAVKTRKRK